MNQAQLIDAISNHHGNEGVSKVAIKFVLDAQSEIAQSELKAGGEVTLPGLGKLSVSKRAARTGRNPATGAELKIKAKNVPKFSAAKALKDAVAG
jgi:DNA-binding protein HU-beta